VSGRLGIEHRLNELEAQVADLTSDILEIRAENEEIKQQMKLMQAIIIRKDKEIDDLKARIIDQKANDMRNNLLLHNIQEKTDENCEQLFRDFLVHEMGMRVSEVAELNIERAHRIGAPRDNKSARPIVAKFLSYKQKEIVLQQWYNATPLKGQKYDPTKKRLSKQIPPEQVQSKSLSYQLLQNVRSKARPGEVKHRFMGENLYINNQLTKPPVKKVSVEMFNISQDEKEVAEKLQQGKSKVLLDRGSTFRAQVFKTTSMNEVRKAYKVYTSHPDQAKASHNILVYSINGDMGWEDDNELGAGHFISRWLKKEGLDNICVVITRQYGGTRLGTQRFRHMQSVTNEAIKNINHAN